MILQHIRFVGPAPKIMCASWLEPLFFCNSCRKFSWFSTHLCNKNILKLAVLTRPVLESSRNKFHWCITCSWIRMFAFWHFGIIFHYNVIIKMSETPSILVLTPRWHSSATNLNRWSTKKLSKHTTLLSTLDIKCWIAVKMLTFLAKFGCSIIYLHYFNLISENCIQLLTDCYLSWNNLELNCLLGHFLSWCNHTLTCK